MALSGSVSTNKYDGRYYKFSWTATQSVASNSSTLTWSLEVLGGDASWYAERTLKLVVNGTTLVNKSDRVERHKGYIRQNQTMTIPHNSDGTKSFSVSLQVACYTSSVNLKASSTQTLNSIPRKATITSAPNFTDEQNPVLYYSNPAGSAVTSLKACISLTGSKADISYRTIPVNGTSYTFTLTDAERNVLRNATTTSNTRTVVFDIETVIGSTKYYDQMTKTLTIANCKPTLSATVTDSNNTTVGLTGSNAKFVKYKSNAAYSITATALKGATISSRKITVGSKSGTSTSGTINAVESGTFVVSTTDSRGNTTSITLSKTMVNYVPLTASLKSTIPTAEGAATLTISGYFFNGSFGSSSNTLTVKYRQKKGTGSYGSWTTVTATKSGNTYSAKVSLTGLDYMSSYTFEASATDVFGTVTTPAKTVKATPVFDWDANDFRFNVPVECVDTLKVGGVITANGTLNGQNAVFNNIEATNIEVATNLTSPKATITSLYDKSGQLVRNGLAAYTSAGIDPDTTLEHLILTNNKTPESGHYMYIKTEFYSSKSATSRRSQIALPYSNNKNPYYRTYIPDTGWTAWVKLATNKVDQTQTLTISNSNFKVYDSTGNYTPTVTRTGSIVFLDGMLTNTATVTIDGGTEAVIATLPTWAWPKRHVSVLQQGSSYHIFWIRIYCDTGKIVFQRYRQTTEYTSHASGKQFPLTANWVAADAF